MLFWEDAYMQGFDAKVISTRENELILDSTCFFASSGGQPSDTGTIGGLRVLEVKSEGGDIIHALEREPSFKVGEAVYGKIDWERRYRIMRLHSACHVMSGVLLKAFGVRKHTGIQISEDKARMDFDMEKLNREVADVIEREANRVIEDHRDIIARITSWEEVNQDAELRRVSEDRYEKIDVPRILEIVGLDKQLDGGTHVRNTNEIGRIRIIGEENKGKNNKRIVLAVD